VTDRSAVRRLALGRFLSSTGSGIGAGVALIATLTFVIPTSRVPVPEP